MDVGHIAGIRTPFLNPSPRPKTDGLQVEKIRRTAGTSSESSEGGNQSDAGDDQNSERGCEEVDEGGEEWRPDPKLEALEENRMIPGQLSLLA